MHGHLGAHHRAARTGDLGAEHPPAPPGQVAEHRAEVVVRDPDLHLVDRLQQHRPARRRRLPQRQRTRGLERGVGGVDAVRLAVDQRRPEVDRRVLGVGQPALQLRPDALLHARDVLRGHRAADDLRLEHEPRAARQRLELDVAHGVLAVPAGLLDVPAGDPRRLRDRLAHRRPGPARCPPRRRPPAAGRAPRRRAPRPCTTARSGGSPGCAPAAASGPPRRSWPAS